jgi:hypothetical protein
MVTQSSLSRIDLKVRTFSCKVLKIEGESRRIEIASEAATERAAGVEAENTNAVPLIRCKWKWMSEGENSEMSADFTWCLTTTEDPAQKPPAAQRLVAAEPINMSTSEAGTL